MIPPHNWHFISIVWILFQCVFIYKYALQICYLYLTYMFGVYFHSGKYSCLFMLINNTDFQDIVL